MRTPLIDLSFSFQPFKEAQIPIMFHNRRRLPELERLLALLLTLLLLHRDKHLSEILEFPQLVSTYDHVLPLPPWSL